MCLHKTLADPLFLLSLQIVATSPFLFLFRQGFGERETKLEENKSINSIWLFLRAGDSCTQVTRVLVRALVISYCSTLFVVADRGFTLVWVKENGVPFLRTMHKGMMLNT